MSNNVAIEATQASLFQKARRRRGHRFNHLVRVIDQPVWIAAAIGRVLRLPGARTAGVDGKTRDDYQTPSQQLELAEGVAEFLRGHYFLPYAMKPVRIEKRAKRGWRTVLVPTIRDRVLGFLLKMILEPIYEPLFLRCSHGYRPRQSRMDAILDCRRLVAGDRLWVYRADIRNCFFSMDQENMVTYLERRVADERVVDLVRSYLEAGACDRGFSIELTPGVPVGFPLSPLLMNIYLNEADQWYMVRFGSRGSTAGASQHQGCWLTRYADNFLFAADSEEHALRIQRELRTFLAAELDLELSEDEVGHAADGFDFLGFHLQWRPFSAEHGRLYVSASAQRINRFKGQITGILKISDDALQTVEDLNQAIATFGSEFRHVDSKHQFRALDHWIEQRLQIGSTQVQSGRAGLLSRKGADWLRKLTDVRREPYQPFTGSPYPPS